MTKLICKMCTKKYEGHFNSKYCSNECKNKGKKISSKKYKNRKRAEKPKCDDLEGEIWKDIMGYEDKYKISNLGRVKSLCRRGCSERILKLVKNKKGYLTVNLRQKTYRIHRLMACNFIPNPDDKPVVDHINRIRDDNRLENLRWATLVENAKNSKSYINAGCILYTSEYDHRYNIYRTGYRAHIHKQRKRSKSLVCVCVWLFENQENLMKHITKL